MNIVIDMSSLVTQEYKERGIARYVKCFLNSLFAIDHENKYFLLNMYENISFKDILEYGDNVTEHYICFGKNYYAIRNEKFNAILGNAIKNFNKQNEIDLYLVTCPFGSFEYNKNWFDGIKCATIFYDLIPFIYRDHYLRVEQIKKKYLSNLEFVKNADSIFAISEQSKEDLINYLNVDSDKIHVIYASTNEMFKVRKISEEQKQNLRAKYNLSDNFILSVSGDEQRKNIEGLLEAYSKISFELQQQYQLVIVCKIIDYRLQYFNELITRFNLRDKVIFTNFMPDEDLIDICNMATIAAFVSKYEGFGLPILEAMRCGLPVLTSNNSSLFEIANGAAVLVDPFNVEDIAKGLEEILTKADLADLSMKGLERANKFTWEKTAHLFFDNLQFIKDKTNTQDINRINIAFFTPLPPIVSGIADYSYELLCELSNYYNIDVYVDDGYEPNCILPKNVQIFSHKLFEDKVVKYDRYIFQMGNSKYHAYMFTYINRYGGILYMHDTNLQDVLRSHSIVPHSCDFKEYRRLLSYDYDDSILDEIISDTYDFRRECIFKYPARGFVTQFSSKILVSSDYAKNVLSNNLMNEANIIKIPLFSHINYDEPYDLKLKARNMLEISENEIVVSTFGNINPAKRILPIIKAIHNLSKIMPNISLNIIGRRLMDMKILESYIIKNNLENNIFIIESVDDQKFYAYMDASDICLNLRYPSNGEFSSSLAKLLSRGKCSIITNIDSFSEIPNNCCVKLSPPIHLTEDQEAEEIYNALLELIYNPGKLKAIEENALQFAKENYDIEKVCQQYIEVINNSHNNVYSNEYLNEYRSNFLQYSSNKNLLKEFEETISLAQGFYHRKIKEIK